MKKFASILSILSIVSCSLLAQDTMYVHQEGSELLKIPLNQIDSLTFNANSDSYVTDYDGNQYRTVEIVGTIWMAENLKTTHYNDGTPILLVSNSVEWVNNTNGAYCWYNNDEYSYKDTYGALYNGYTVSTNKLCPTGWHVSTGIEWYALSDSLGGNNIAADHLKENSSRFWIFDELNTHPTNKTGFSALPGGTRNGKGYNDGEGGEFYSICSYGFWWRSHPENGDPSFVNMSYITSRVTLGGGTQNLGHSVRCVKD